MNDKLETRVLLKQRVLHGSDQPEALQRVATVYINGKEYRVWAPPEAIGDALGWVPHCTVRQLVDFDSEVEIRDRFGVLTLKAVKEELEKEKRDVDRTQRVHEPRNQEQDHFRQGLEDGNLTVKPSTPGIKLVYSYSHKDKGFRDELASHLSPLEREGLISSWYDRCIVPGKEFDREIDAQFDRAQIILLLVSADFIASEYCYGREMKKAMERHEAGDARVIPVIVRPVDWSGTPFRKLLGLPDDGQAVTSWSNRDEAYLNTVRGVRRAAEEILSPKSHRSCPIVLKIGEIFYTAEFDGIFVGAELQNPASISYQVTDWSLSIFTLNGCLKPYFSPFGTGRYNGPKWWRMPLDLPARKITTGALFFSFSHVPSWRERISREEPLHATISAHIFPAGLSEQPIEIYKLNTMRERDKAGSPVSGLTKREAKILSCAAQGDGSILVTGSDQIADRCFVRAGPCFLPYESGSFPKADFEPWIEAVDTLIARGLIELKSKRHQSETYVLAPLARELIRSA
jgi:hypothetical protein